MARLGRPSKLPRRRAGAAAIDLADVQGDVLRGYTHPAAAYLFLRIDNADKARALMRRMLPHVSTAEPWRDGPPPSPLSVAFTYSGLEALGLPDALLGSFPEEFREGMAARAERLGDRGPSAPAAWEPGLGTGEAHVLVTVYGTDEERLAQRRGELRAVGAEGAVTLVAEHRAAAMHGGRDHFGFFDGIAQPAIEGSGASPRPGDGLPDGRGWRPVRAGEFLHGHIDEDSLLPDAPAAPLDRNGTFMVYRKLHMDVAAFRRFIASEGERFAGGPELLAAKIVGRWRDGTPLTLSPDRPDASIAADPARINDFRYSQRRRGAAVPGRRPHPPRQPARRPRLLGRAALQPPPPRPPRALLRAGAPAGRDGGRRRRPRARLRLLQREHLAPVRDRPGALDRRRRPVRAGAGQGPAGRRAARHRRQDDHPRLAAPLRAAAAALRDDAGRRVPLPAVHQRSGVAQLLGV